MGGQSMSTRHVTFILAKTIKRVLWVLLPVICMSQSAVGSPNPPDADGTPRIKYLIVLFQENNSFDHYFGTYPAALNPQGEPQFHADPTTPRINGLQGPLLFGNQNGAAPFRLDRSQAVTCGNTNDYTAEQLAFDHGLADKFLQFTSATGSGCTPNLAMGYYDGNTVTALWNYAQHFAMSDNAFDTEFGSTVLGHLNLISGQTHQTGVDSIPKKIANGSVIANVEAGYDDCAAGTLVQMTGKNVGDLLNDQGVTWGWFYGDFASNALVNGKAICSNTYNSHYDPFQYYASTANPHHLPPSSVALIGHTDQANHQYDLNSFWSALAGGSLPAVSFLKAQTLFTGHPTDSDPLHEQQFLVNTINRLQQSPYWKDMAIIITYDDSGGWYDHVIPPIINPSNDPAHDALGGPDNLCGTPAPGAYQDRCGYGERLPFLVISPYAKRNYVDHATIDTSSILRFIEANWGLGFIDGPNEPLAGQGSFDRIAGSIEGMFDFERSPQIRPLILDETTGGVVSGD